MRVTEASSGVYQIHFPGTSYLAAFSGREFTNAERGDFLSVLGLSEDSLYRVKQVHGKKVVRVERGHPKEPRIEADGLHTHEPGVILGILTADCVPVFFRDPVHQAVGLAHAGWRGIHVGIIQEMVQALIESYGTQPKDLKITFGPAIRECCYEVGPEFCEYFPERCHKRVSASKELFVADLAGAVTDILLERGVQAGSIVDTKICTSCQNDKFFSARKDRGTSERILSVIRISKL
ncbi:MAG TPA: peptidoglycan editing factor PgeF [bacterium]|nr:peptidoglycan editing factor PgeF [bacterium]